MEGSSMSFFGVEVKSGQSLKVEPPTDKVLHLSQANLGEVTADAKKDKGNESVCLYLKIDDQKFVLGTLSHDKFPQIPFDLVFEREFELSHNWKNGSVYVSGYYVYYQSMESYGDELELANAEKTNTTQPTAKQVKIVEPKKEEDGGDDNNSSEEDDSSDEDDEPNDDQKDQVLLHNGENESDEDSKSDEEDSDDESSDEDQETPEKVEVEPSKKRSGEPSTPVPGKKAKVDTPVKTDGKKVVGHTATPHPSKLAGKTIAKSAQTKQTPKSIGSHVCNSCGRKFGSDLALQAHSKAKHSAAA